MKRAIYAAVVLVGAALASPASADVLHGACLGCTEVQIGGNDVTLLGPGGVTGLGFTNARTAYPSANPTDRPTANVISTEGVIAP